MSFFVKKFDQSRFVKIFHKILFSPAMNIHLLTREVIITKPQKRMNIRGFEHVMFMENSFEADSLSKNMKIRSQFYVKLS